MVESLEADASLLLIDEDTSATNFMIRDELMQRVIHRDMEPITSFIDRIRELYETYGVSTIVVAGSSGSYFHVADSIIQMDRYIPRDITAYAKKEASAFPVQNESVSLAPKPNFNRKPKASSEFRDLGRIKMKTLGSDGVMIQRETIDLRYVEQIADAEQVTALGYCVLYAQKHLLNGQKTLRQIAQELDQLMEQKTLEALCENPSHVSPMARPRKQEILACFNRYRALLHYS